MFTIRVQHDDFDLSAEQALVRARHRDVGAITSFVGVVRDINDGRDISTMTLEHYPGMTEAALKKIVDDAARRWNVIDATVIHRVGELAPRDQIVLVLVASRHRGHAFEACEFIMDFLKTEDPLDAIARSIETCISLAENDKIPNKDTLRYGNRNKICFEITKGKISPWMLYHSTSGVEFIESLDVTQQKMIFEYINPEQWAIKFKRSANIINEVKELLKAAGY